MLGAMLKKLPTLPQIKLSQVLKPATESQVDALDALIILLPESALHRRWPEFPHRQRLRKLLPAGVETLAPTRADLPNTRGTAVVLASVKSGASTFELLN